MPGTLLIPKSVQSNGVVDLAASRRLAAQIESHATALRSWAGILLTRLRDIADRMEQEATIAAGLARKLAQIRGA